MGIAEPLLWVMGVVRLTSRVKEQKKKKKKKKKKNEGNFIFYFNFFLLLLLLPNQSCQYPI
jgi:hypothetical protein